MQKNNHKEISDNQTNLLIRLHQEKERKNKVTLQYIKNL